MSDRIPCIVPFCGRAAPPEILDTVLGGLVFNEVICASHWSRLRPRRRRAYRRAVKHLCSSPLDPNWSRVVRLWRRLKAEAIKRGGRCGMICSLPYCQDQAWHGESSSALCERHFRLAPLSFRRVFQRAMKAFREAEARGELKPHVIIGWNCFRRGDKWLCMSPSVSTEFYRAQDRLVRVWKRLRREVISDLTGTPRFERRRKRRPA